MAFGDCLDDSIEGEATTRLEIYPLTGIKTGKEGG
jgi:hypothetical protein